MIIYEVSMYDRVRFFFSNKRKASAFVAQNKKTHGSLEIKKHLVPNNKTDIIKFLNRDD